MDIQAAGSGGAKALGVLTGVYSRQDLEGCGTGNNVAHSGLFAYDTCVFQILRHLEITEARCFCTASGALRFAFVWHKTLLQL